MGQVACDACLILAGTVNSTLNRQQAFEVIRAVGIMACGFVLEVRNCQGFIDYYIPSVTENVFEINLSPGYICQHFLNICNFKQYR